MSTISIDVSESLVAKIAVDTVLARERRIRELEAKHESLQARYSTFVAVVALELNGHEDLKKAINKEWKRIKKEQGWHD